MWIAYTYRAAGDCTIVMSFISDKFVACINTTEERQMVFIFLFSVLPKEYDFLKAYMFGVTIISGAYPNNLETMQRM